MKLTRERMEAMRALHRQKMHEALKNANGAKKFHVEPVTEEEIEQYIEEHKKA